MTKILTPQQLAPVMEIARDLLPPGMELVVVDPTKPEFYDVAADAEYYLGSPRHGIGNEFFRAAPKLKLVQLTSAGYDRVDIEAARKAKVPVGNNGGANSVAVAEHAVMLMLAVLKKLVYHHNNVAAGTWRAADFAALRTYEVEANGSASLVSATSARRSRAAFRASTWTFAITTSSASPRIKRTRSACGLPSSRSSSAPPTS